MWSLRYWTTEKFLGSVFKPFTFKVIVGIVGLIYIMLVTFLFICSLFLSLYSSPLFSFDQAFYMLLFYILLSISMGIPGGSIVKNPPANVGLIPGSERAPEEGNGNPL